MNNKVYMITGANSKEGTGLRQSYPLRWPIFAFPLLLTLGIVLIPVVPDYTNHALAAEAVGQTWRWFSGHILAAIAFALSIWAVSCLDQHLRISSGPLHPTIIAVLVTGAGVNSAGLGADGIGPVAVRAAGEAPEVFFEGSGVWVTALFMTGTILFAAGLISVVVSSIRRGLLQGVGRWVAFIGALVTAVAPAILSGWALYGVAAAMFAVFIPLGLATLHREGEGASS